MLIKIYLYIIVNCKIKTARYKFSLCARVCMFVYRIFIFYFLFYKMFNTVPDDGVLRQKYSIPHYTINTKVRCRNAFVMNYVQYCPYTKIFISLNVNVLKNIVFAFTVVILLDFP
jgi:hypothetical protein